MKVRDLMTKLASCNPDARIEDVFGAEIEVVYYAPQQKRVAFGDAENAEKVQPEDFFADWREV